MSNDNGRSFSCGYILGTAFTLFVVLVAVSRHNESVAKQKTAIQKAVTEAFTNLRAGKQQCCCQVK